MSTGLQTVQNGRPGESAETKARGEGMTTDRPLILVLGATGKTGRRVLERLVTRNVPVRAGSRSGEPPFDWDDGSTWGSALEHASAVYLTYYPDLAVPGAVEAVRAFTETATSAGVQRLVLLSGRGEAEAQRAEEVVRNAGLEWTILRANWFNQNFSENFLLEPLLTGELFLPSGAVPEPFVDADDIADVAVAALIDGGHRHLGQIYELSGPRLLTLEEAVSEIAAATRREIRFTHISPEQYRAAMTEAGAPDDVVWLVNYLFTTVLDGRNSSVTDGVQRALGRAPRDFSAYARRTAASGVWNAPALVESR